MKLWISALVTCAALATPAWAIERPPAATTAARPCPAWGPGFVHIPGSDTCVRVKGRVTTDYEMGGGRRVSRDDIAGFGATARVEMDARSQTDYGPVRTFVRVKAGRTSGNQ